jgi:hypothetical protein
LIEKHYVSKRSRRQKGVLAFLARDAKNSIFCFADGDIRKAEQNDAIVKFCEYWKDRTGHYPDEVIFDSKLTTYGNLNWLNIKGIKFMTLRRRSKELLAEVRASAPEAWRQIRLSGVGRQYRTPRVLDQRIELKGYSETIRQLVITDLGHEEPTFMLTNQLSRSSPSLVDRYAKRMLIENAISDGIDFFHMDALTSVVPMKLNCDLMLTCLASSLYRMLAGDIGRGYESARARTVFENFLRCTSTVQITPQEEIIVRFQKRAHNPLLVAAGFQEKATRIPWFYGRPVRFVFG